MTTRKDWLLSQIRKCDELLKLELSSENAALVRKLHSEFREDLTALTVRQDDADESSCNCGIKPLAR